MRPHVVLPSLFLVLSALTSTSEAASESTDSGGKVGANQGLTFEDIGRGLKSAAKNIGDEIPKIGPAIGETFKKVTGSDKGNAQPKEPPQTSTKGKK
ncbi:MAG: hypothetical protein OJF47_001477 [Nitrospira sp.]|jgi:hypothetical protein|nr:MAG: hypothetical protein OJF47_001477 [Nitrospira sp.]